MQASGAAMVGARYRRGGDALRAGDGRQLGDGEVDGGIGEAVGGVDGEHARAGPAGQGLRLAVDLA